ncbi:hypothetical protein GGI19_005442 [Coemansia pectinata]|uniref:Uncharacterized protein n=1 Tax=Coemansia pectinata TaxID=1052879 RepID=A0A9W8GU98_9FUNG|nr:hypothetical protein GGI19_005442 [Coemansia pectinata]
MKVLALFLFLSAAVAQAQKDSSSSAPPASTVEDNTASPSDTAVVFTPPKSSQEAHSAEPSGSYEPLFNFDLEPYNMALEIVADALEKLSDTMEPLDLPLPLVGPGYYLEVQVKSPKNAHGSVPFSQINAVTIEGGQAPPVTQVEVILPGESVAHETFMLPVDSISASSTPTVASETEIVSSPVAHDISPTESISTTEPETEISIAPSSSVASVPLSPTPASIEPTSIPLSGASASANNLINSAIEQLYSQGAFDGHASGFLAVGTIGILHRSGASAAAPISISEEILSTEIPSLSDSSAQSSSQVNSASSPEPSAPLSIISAAPIATTNTALSATATAAISASASASALDTAFAPWSPYMSMQSSSISSAEATPFPGLGGLGSIFAGAYGSSVALQEQSLSIGISAGVSFSGSIAGLVPSASANALPTDSNFMPTSEGLSILPVSTQSDKPSADVVSSMPSLPLSVPIMTDPPMVSSEPLSIPSPPSSMFPLDVAQAHSQQSPVSAGPLASSIEAGLSAVPTTVADASALASSGEDEDVDEESMTMATAPLPFPPFGGPQHQQEPSFSNDSASETAELAALPTASSGGLLETIDIISASNDNALESSIDAILHSVIQDYKTQSIPKAAVGFALIHPRRQAAANARY